MLRLMTHVPPVRGMHYMFTSNLHPASCFECLDLPRLISFALCAHQLRPSWDTADFPPLRKPGEHDTDVVEFPLSARFVLPNYSGYTRRARRCCVLMAAEHVCHAGTASPCASVKALRLRCASGSSSDNKDGRQAESPADSPDASASISGSWVDREQASDKHWLDRAFPGARQWLESKNRAWMIHNTTAAARSVVQRLQIMPQAVNYWTAS